MIAIKHLEINQNLALDNPKGVDVPLNKTEYKYLWLQSNI